MNDLSTDEAKSLIERIREGILDARMLVLELYERNGWGALGYSSWRACVVAEFQQSQSRLYQLLEAAKIERNISTMVETQIAERVLRPLARLDADQQRIVWAEVIKTANNPSAKEVKSAIEKVFPEASGKLRNPPKERAGTAEVIALFDKGCTLAEISAQTGVRPRIVDSIIREEKIRRETPPPVITPDMLSMPAKQKVALAIRQIEEELHKENARKFQEMTERYFADFLIKLQKRELEAKRVLQGRFGYMKRATYRKILSCLHPDWVTDQKQKERYEDAFREFAKLEKCVLDERESPSPFPVAPDLPKTPAEWAEAKRKVSEARKVKRDNLKPSR